ncbi:MAG: AlpA family phage regulatory protein [Hyphomicrobiales bacterium]|nr:MAG: AlpA family phage regulatory protein [Hyphomicrobiales bacterium]
MENRFTRSSEPKRFLRIRDVSESIGFSRGHIYELMKKGQFPKPVKVGHASLWPSSEIDEWSARQVAQRDSAAA